MFRTLAKLINGWIGRPYMSIRVRYRPNGSLGISAVFNQHFIDDLDHNYTEAKNPDYNPMLADNVKLAFYLADGFDAILGRFDQSMLRDKLRADDEDEDPFASVPDLKMSPIRDVIDISTMQKAGGQID